jgi:glycosyltransferase involved in cell wall biosynthesis
VHCLRAPVGGLFRHVCDLARGQIECGLTVGLICAAPPNNSFADRALSELASGCRLGVHRVPMSRHLSWSDAIVLSRVVRICEKCGPDIIHGHGAKGGAYGRLAAKRGLAKSVYTPHGGSLHYRRSSYAGWLYIGLERHLKPYTGGLIFESKFSADTYTQKIGAAPCPSQIIPNGLNDHEFAPVTLSEDAYDFAFIGELRKIKGLEVLVRAVTLLPRDRPLRILAVGAGSDARWFSREIRRLDLQSTVTVLPPVYPATRAFAKARCLVVPSLAESLPYIVLEAVGARVPLLATRVGGIPEIFGPFATQLVQPGDPQALADAMAAMTRHPAHYRLLANELHNYVRSRFRVDNMVRSVVTFYHRVLSGTAPMDDHVKKNLPLHPSHYSTARTPLPVEHTVENLAVVSNVLKGTRTLF